MMTTPSFALMNIAVNGHNHAPQLRVPQSVINRVHRVYITEQRLTDLTINQDLDKHV